MLSAKAAFLWNAMHPHPVSAKLVDHMRAYARIPGFGYASGAFFKSDAITGNYSDINTNAIILQPVARHLFDARKNGP